MPAKIPKEKFLSDIKKVARETDGYLTSKEYTKKGEYNGGSAARRFGGWPEALKKANVNRTDKTIPKSKILEDLRRVNNKLDSKISKRDYRKHGKYSDNTVRRILNCTWDEAKRKAGLDIIKEMRPNYKYDINEDFFKEWDSNTAYVFGYLLADGSVITDRKVGDEYKQIQYTVKFLTKDREILENIKEAMDADHPVREVECKTRGKYRTYYAFYFSRKEIVQDLLDLGVEQNKTESISFPDFVPRKYLNDFVRGFFDGDGSITSSKSVVFTTKSKNFIDSLNNHLSKELDLELREPRCDSYNCFSISYSTKEERAKIRDYMYPVDDILYLSRKKKRFKQSSLRGYS